MGFAGNLDRACQGATGDRMLLLSSDDLAKPEAFGTYAALAEALGPAADNAVFAAGYEVIDGDGARTGEAGFDRRAWPDAEIDENGILLLHLRTAVVSNRAINHPTRRRSAAPTEL